MKKLKCPKCESGSVELVNYMEIKCLKCNNCGFDETSEYEVYPQQKTSQKAKGSYSPYKKGGHGRTAKQ